MRTLIAVLALLATAGCGGAASGPDDYMTYEAPAASFVHPQGWTVKRDNTEWRATAPGDRNALIVLSVQDVDFESAHAEHRVRFKTEGKQETVVMVHAVPKDRKSVVQLVSTGHDDGLDGEAVARSLELEAG
ncbi:hypothetical protein OJ997_22275 [Solirubrobacter phytolaccae]|uniref:Lipoprotein n=1 Tax=Solirubrobacter phytolaccae TaxID=1404360 RepID=A0A9X3NDT1_9ACTN|nr:hypothetical protein [Solirubrobacter phytolaccae]MDA0183052.1 hypothetical protein [Solirubrobacter phytolaccae]